jgi:hypothetical protein
VWLAVALLAAAAGCAELGPAECSEAALAAPVPGGAFVRAARCGLWLDGRPVSFVGANRYELASAPPGAGDRICGRGYSDADLDAIVAGLVDATSADLLRAWAFRRFTRDGDDFTTLDRLIEAARRQGLRLVLALENEWADCSAPDPDGADGRKSARWYRDGYRHPGFDGKLAYRDYVGRVVTRYRDEPVVALWQLLNEPESPDGAALYDFAADVSALIRSLDPNHLVGLGTIGGGQPGTDGAAFVALNALDTIDVVEAHDYSHPPDHAAAKEPIPGHAMRRFDSVFGALREANRLGKPFVLGEVGIPAPPPEHPFTPDERAALMREKLAAHRAAGTDAFLVWSWHVPGVTIPAGLGFDFDAADPLAAALQTAR